MLPTVRTSKASVDFVADGLSSAKAKNDDKKKPQRCTASGRRKKRKQNDKPASSNKKTASRRLKRKRLKHATSSKFPTRRDKIDEEDVDFDAIDAILAHDLASITSSSSSYTSENGCVSSGEESLLHSPKPGSILASCSTFLPSRLSSTSAESDTCINTLYSTNTFSTAGPNGTNVDIQPPIAIGPSSPHHPRMGQYTKHFQSNGAASRNPKSKTMTPKGKTMTPKSETMTPKSKTKTPKGETMTPKSKTMTPKSKTLTPLPPMKRYKSATQPKLLFKDPSIWSIETQDQQETNEMKDNMDDYEDMVLRKLDSKVRVLLSPNGERTLKRGIVTLPPSERNKSLEKLKHQVHNLGCDERRYSGGKDEGDVAIVSTAVSAKHQNNCPKSETRISREQKLLRKIESEMEPLNLRAFGNIVDPIETSLGFSPPLIPTRSEVEYFASWGSITQVLRQQHWLSFTAASRIQKRCRGWLARKHTREYRRKVLFLTNYCQSRFRIRRANRLKLKRALRTFFKAICSKLLNGWIAVVEDAKATRQKWFLARQHYRKVVFSESFVYWRLFVLKCKSRRAAMRLQDNLENPDSGISLNTQGNDGAGDLGSILDLKVQQIWEARNKLELQQKQADHHLKSRTLLRHFEEWHELVHFHIIPMRNRFLQLTRRIQTAILIAKIGRAVKLATDVHLRWQTIARDRVEHRKKLVKVFLNCLPCSVDNSSSQKRVAKIVDRHWHITGQQRYFSRWSSILKLKLEFRKLAVQFWQIHESKVYGSSLGMSRFVVERSIRRLKLWYDEDQTSEIYNTRVNVGVRTEERHLSDENLNMLVDQHTNTIFNSDAPHLSTKTNTLKSVEGDKPNTNKVQELAVDETKVIHNNVKFCSQYLYLKPLSQHCLRGTTLAGYWFGVLPTYFWRWSYFVARKQKAREETNAAKAIYRTNQARRIVQYLRRRATQRVILEHQINVAISFHRTSLLIRYLREWAEQAIYVPHAQNGIARTFHRRHVLKNTYNTWCESVIQNCLKYTLRDTLDRMLDVVEEQHNYAASCVQHEVGLKRRGLLYLFRFREEMLHKRRQRAIAQKHNIRLCFRYWSQKLSEVYYNEAYAALTIQCWVRTRQANLFARIAKQKRDLEIEEKREALEAAVFRLGEQAALIQGLYRGVQGRKIARQMKIESDIAFQKHQKKVRESAVKEKEVKERVIQNYEVLLANRRQARAVLLLQRYIRGQRDRRTRVRQAILEAKLKQARSNMFAFKIQKMIRGYIQFKSQNAIRIQSWFRGIVARIDLKIYRVWFRLKKRKDRLDGNFFRVLRVFFKSYGRTRTIANVLGFFSRITDPDRTLENMYQFREIDFWARRNYEYTKVHGSKLAILASSLNYKYVRPLSTAKRHLRTRWREYLHPTDSKHFKLVDAPKETFGNDPFSDIRRNQILQRAEEERSKVDRMHGLLPEYQHLSALQIQTVFRGKAARERYKCRRAKLFLIHQSPKLIKRLEKLGIRNRYKQVEKIRKLQRIGLTSKVKWKTIQEVLETSDKIRTIRESNKLDQTNASDSKLLLFPKDDTLFEISDDTGIVISKAVEQKYEEWKSLRQTRTKHIEHRSKFGRRGGVSVESNEKLLWTSQPRDNGLLSELEFVRTKGTNVWKGTESQQVLANMNTTSTQSTVLQRRGGIQDASHFENRCELYTDSYSVGGQPVIYTGFWCRGHPLGYGVAEFVSSTAEFRKIIGCWSKSIGVGCMRINYTDCGTYEGYIDSKWNRNQEGRYVFKDSSFLLCEIILDFQDTFQFDNLLDLGLLQLQQDGDVGANDSVASDESELTPKEPQRFVSRLEQKMMQEEEKLKMENESKKAQELALLRQQDQAMAAQSRVKHRRGISLSNSILRNPRKLNGIDNARRRGAVNTNDFEAKSQFIRENVGSRWGNRKSVGRFDLSLDEYWYEDKERQSRKAEEIERSKPKPNFATYNGGWRKGLMHGKGVLILPNGYSYFGDFNRGRFHGFGVMSCPDGSKYFGYFWKGMKHRRGRFEFPKPEDWPIDEAPPFYEGEWRYGVPHGMGRMGSLMVDPIVNQNEDNNNRSRYLFEGLFADGTRFGRATVFYSNGDRRIGVWSALGKLQSWLSDRISISKTATFCSQFTALADYRGEYAMVVHERYVNEKEQEPFNRVPLGVDPDNPRVREILKKIEQESQIQVMEDSQRRLGEKLKVKQLAVKRLAVKKTKAHETMTQVADAARSHLTSIPILEQQVWKTEKKVDKEQWFVVEKVLVADETLRTIGRSIAQPMSTLGKGHILALISFSRPPDCVLVLLATLYQIVHFCRPFDRHQEVTLQIEDEEGISNETDNTVDDVIDETKKSKPPRQSWAPSQNLIQDKVGSVRLARPKFEDPRPMIPAEKFLDMPNWFEVCELFHREKPEGGKEASTKLLVQMGRPDWKRCRCDPTVARVTTRNDDKLTTTNNNVLSSTTTINSDVYTESEWRNEHEEISMEVLTKFRNHVGYLVHVLAYGSTKKAQEQFEPLFDLPVTCFSYDSCNLIQREALKLMWQWVFVWWSSAETNWKLYPLRYNVSKARLKLRKARASLLHGRQLANGHRKKVNLAQTTYADLVLTHERAKLERDELEARMQQGLGDEIDENEYEALLSENMNVENATELHQMQESLLHIRRDHDMQDLLLLREQETQRKRKIALISLESTIESLEKKRLPALAQAKVEMRALQAENYLAIYDLGWVPSKGISIIAKLLCLMLGEEKHSWEHFRKLLVPNGSIHGYEKGAKPEIDITVIERIRDFNEKVDLTAEHDIHITQELTNNKSVFGSEFFKQRAIERRNKGHIGASLAVSTAQVISKWFEALRNYAEIGRQIKPLEEFIDKAKRDVVQSERAERKIQQERNALEQNEIIVIGRLQRIQDRIKAVEAAKTRRQGQVLDMVKNLQEQQGLLFEPGDDSDSN